MGNYLAVDIGASGGRHILGYLEGGFLRLREIRRFPNGMVKRGGQLCWDTEALYAELLAGIEDCKAAGHTPDSIGIDTWGVDFVLLDETGRMPGDAVAYRDSRTAGMDKEVEKLVPYAEHFKRTGIQKQPFNTVYQLMALRLREEELLSRADCMLLMPDYLHYRLRGEKRAEYTNASTTALLDARTRDWDYEIIDRLGFPRRLFPPVRQGINPSHDTGSAFMAASVADSVLISSGTWSLLGISTGSPILSDAARDAGFSNEGGYGGSIRFLKNIMGLWMVQSIRAEMPGKASYDELEQAARDSVYPGMVDVGDSAFFAPESMTGAVERACCQGGYPPPRSVGDLLRCVYRSLARAYAQSVRELESITGQRFRGINIIGGGSKDAFLNRLTAEASGLPVSAGPAEGTALGNIVAQMLAEGEISGREEARELIRRSFAIEEYMPYAPAKEMEDRR